jgi:DnaK suppressor protein
VIVTTASESSDLSACGNWDVESSQSKRDRDRQDRIALAWDLRVYELERTFALSMAPPVNTQGDSQPARNVQERTLAYVRIAATRWAIHEIDAALTRIENGDYGHCEWCSRPIAPELLATSPIGRLCSQCRAGDWPSSQAGPSTDGARRKPGNQTARRSIIADMLRHRPDLS